MSNYDLCMNVDLLGVEGTSKYIAEFVNNREYITK